MPSASAVALDLLVKLGFKEIEVGFPRRLRRRISISCSELIEGDLVPRDVTIQVLTQSRSELIRRTFDAIAGSRRAIVHLYNSTSELQRRVVFGQDRAGIIDIAVTGAKLIGDLASKVSDTEIIHEYSPESFTGTELDFAVEICEAVLETWGATPTKMAILNLPATVEMATPNVLCRPDRMVRPAYHWPGPVCTCRCIRTTIAAPESRRAELAGAGRRRKRVEGTLFGEWRTNRQCRSP